MDTALLKVFDDLQQMAHGSRKAIQPDNDKDIAGGELAK
jgi:hypothetical protein